MKKVREVLRLYLLTQISAKKIQGATDVARTTIQEYIKRRDNASITSVKMLNSLNDDLQD